MAKRHQLHLTDEQIQVLRQLRNTGEPAYLRERAAGLLKIAAGSSRHKVARITKSLCVAWSYGTAASQKTGGLFQHFVGQNPVLLPPHEARWTLRTLGASVPWLSEYRECEASSAADTVYAMASSIQVENGVMGLRHKPGKGRKPVFAPLSETESAWVM